MDNSTAHKTAGDMNWYGVQHYPDGLVPWRPARAPDLAAGHTTGLLRGCSYCGSMHPSDVVAAIEAGATGHWADRKYGWPHKAYFDGIPNPHVGLSEIRTSAYGPTRPAGDNWEEVAEARFDERTGERLADRIHWVIKEPAQAKTHGKFYSVHLLDATPEERDIIQRHLGLAITFHEDGKVSWQPA